MSISRTEGQFSNALSITADGQLVEGQFSNTLSLSSDGPSSLFSVPFHESTSTDNEGSYSDDETEWSSIITIRKHYLHTNQKVATDVSTITRDFSLDTASTLESNNDIFLVETSTGSSPVAAASPIRAVKKKMTSKEEMYRHLQEKVQHEYFVTWEMPNSNEYTSAFVDPISRELFLSGDLTQCSTRKGEGLVWYKEAIEAEEAAVARALDCFDLRNKTPRMEGQRVEESPYLVGDEPAVPSSICPKVMHRLGMVCKSPKLDPIGSHEITPDAAAHDDPTQFTKVSSPQPWNSDAHPVQALIKFYNNNRAFFGLKQRIVVRATNYLWWSNPHNLHTCAFVCPVFGDIFLAGTLIQITDATSSSRFETMNGLNWYGSKREAQKAAAGHALDCLSRRKTKLKDSRHQFCLEVSSPELIKSFDDIVQLVPPGIMEQIQDLRGSCRS